MSWRTAPFCLSGMVLESGGLGTFTSSLGLWFGGSTFRALRCLGILEALTGLWLLRRGQERASESLRLAGASVGGLEKRHKIALDFGGFRTAFFFFSLHGFRIKQNLGA